MDDYGPGGYMKIGSKGICDARHRVDIRYLNTFSVLDKLRRSGSLIWATTRSKQTESIRYRKEIEMPLPVLQSEEKMKIVELADEKLDAVIEPQLITFERNKQSTLASAFSGRRIINIKELKNKKVLLRK